jgi:hypothetical protein
MAYLTYIGSTYKTFSCLNVPKCTSGVTKAKCYKYNSCKDVSFHFVLYGMFCLIFVPLLQEITDRANSTVVIHEMKPSYKWGELYSIFHQGHHHHQKR